MAEKYDWCLFIRHLVLEKARKAIFIKNHNTKIPPKIHNLLKLASISDLKLSNEKELLFGEINEFNIEARYADYKSDSYKKWTGSFTERYFIMIKEQYRWLKSQIK